MSLKIEYPVSAETIYNHLGIKTPLKAWFKSKCKQLDLKEGLDYEGYKLTPLAYTQLIGQGLLKSEFKSEALVQNLKLCSVSGYIWDNLFYGERCMTSREFAELVQMRHHNVLRDIKDLLSKLEQDFSYKKLLKSDPISVESVEESLSRINQASREMVGQFTLSSYKDSTGRELPEYLLTRDAALQLAARYSPHIVARLLADIREASDSKKVQFIYILYTESLPEIKIGISNAPLDRISNLQSGNAHELRLAYLSPCTTSAREIEKELHKHFKDCSTAGTHKGGKEWFLVDKEEAIDFAKRFEYQLTV